MLSLLVMVDTYCLNRVRERLAWGLKGKVINAPIPLSWCLVHNIFLFHSPLSVYKFSQKPLLWFPSLPWDFISLKSSTFMSSKLHPQDHSHDHHYPYTTIEDHLNHFPFNATICRCTIDHHTNRPTSWANQQMPTPSTTATTIQFPATHHCSQPQIWERDSL